MRGHMRNTAKMVAITGASSGLGAALAKEYAGDGVHLFLCARRTELLEQVADDCRTQGAKVACSGVDVTSLEEVDRWHDTITASAPVDLVIVNAGVFDGNPTADRLENAAGAANLIDVNLRGTIVTASAFARSMQGRGHGRLALVGSLAAYAPEADAPAYSASKAGVDAYGKALREYLRPHGVAVTIVPPGHIDSAQTRIQFGPLPGMISAERAAAKIKRALDRGRSHVVFPRWLFVLIALENFLPWRVRARINRWFRFTVRK